MTDSSREDTESAERRPLAGLEFEVSRVVQRLQAGAGGGAATPPGAAPAAAPALLHTETSMDEVLRSVERLVRETADSTTEEEGDEEEEGGGSGARGAGDAGRLARAALLGHAAAAHCAGLERAHLARLHHALAADTALWLQDIFRLPGYHAHYHYEPLEGLVRVTRLLLHLKYPRYVDEGVLALSARLPGVYSSVGAPLGVVQHLCRALGLPLACVRPVPPCARHHDYTLCAECLSRVLAADAAEGAARLPLLVLGAAGAGPLGAVDPPLRAACRAHGAHLHLRGGALAGLALHPPDRSGDAYWEPPCDSLTLTPGAWLGVPALPAVTMYLAPQPAAPSPAPAASATAAAPPGEYAQSSIESLAGLGAWGGHAGALPLWSVLRAGGRGALPARVAAAAAACHALHALLADMPALRVLSARPGGDSGLHVDSLLAAHADPATCVSVAAPCVSFQFVGPPERASAAGEEAAPPPPPPPPRPPPYYDRLNSWLGQILQREVQQVETSVCMTERHGVVVRVSPLEGSGAGGVGELAACLAQQLDILAATLALKKPFAELVDADPRLRLVDVPGWAGLGGVRYVPLGWETLPTDQARAELDSLNRALVESLRDTDSAFSCGRGDDGLACVRFGMVTADTDVAELLELVAAVGGEAEESSRALDTMTEIVKKGIETASSALAREAEERLWAEGVLRRVPVVGRVVDWWAPAAAAPPRGRTLHLARGTVESTENIYKYHMQLPAGSTPAGAPPAQEQTALGSPSAPSPAPSL